MMNSDQEITIALSLPQALSLFLSRLTERWHLFAAVWLVTSVGGLLLQDLMLPTILPWETPTIASLGPPLLLMLVANLFSLFGALLVMRLFTESVLSGEQFGRIMGRLVSRGGYYLLTLLLSVLRILLVGLGSFPLVLLAGLFLYGAAQGTFSALLEQALVAAPILLFLVIGVARFGWALFFAVLHGSPPVRSVRLSKALFATNRRPVWVLTAILISGPVGFTLLNGLTTISFWEISHPFSYVSSLWTFLASGFAAILIGSAREKDGETRAS